MPSEHPLLPELETRFQHYADEQQAIDVIALATTDGFPVHSYTRSPGDFATDTLAAAASTLYSVSNAVAQQILGKRFKVTFIEAEQGNVAFVALSVQDRDYVLTMSAKAAMNIANLRLQIQRLATEISGIDRPAVA